MGTNNGNSWFNAVKRAFNGKQQEEKKRGNWRWLTRKNNYLNASNLMPKVVVNRVESEERSAISIAVAIATTAAAEAAVKTAQAALQVMRFSTISVLARQHHAALVIQSFYRGYLGRRALQGLKGVVKLQALIRGYNVRKRANITLQCIQSLVRVQAHVCNQRRRLSSYEGSVRRKSVMAEKNEDPFEFEVEDESRSSDKKTLCFPLRRHSFTLPESEEFFDPSYRNHLHFSVGSLKTPSSCKIRRAQVRSSSHDCKKEEQCQQAAKTPTSCLFNSPRTSFSENSSFCFNRPNFMAATASARARVKSNGAQKLNFSSPSREPVSSAKKRLVFTL